MTDDVLVIGEALVDVVTTPDGRTTELPGGSPANVAVALARLERPVRFATAYADDAYGRLLADHLAGSGVTVSPDPHVVARTSSARATIGTDGSASYVFDLDWRLADVPVGAPRFVHVGSIGAVLSPGADSVLAVLESLPDSVLVSYDVNARPAITGTGPEVVAGVERVAACADVVKASDEDLATFYPDLTTDGAAKHLLSLGARAVAVTLGAAGAAWLSADGRVEVASEPVSVVDTIGAGDTFSAGLIDALWDGFDADPRAVLRHAVRAAAVTVSRAGANPPYRHELD